MYVKRYKEALKINNELMPFIEEIMSTKLLNNRLFGNIFNVGHNRLMFYSWYPMFLFKLGYTQAVQDIEKRKL